jgi:hypothetical protein
MTVRIITGDCRDMLKTLPDASVDSIVTDPPYGLSFMGKRWDYDVPAVEVWAECLRVLKPGGYLLAFAGTRTQHRMACRIEDAGFEIRDMIAWCYSSGFPKSHNLDNYRGKTTCGCESAAERVVRPVRNADVPEARFAVEERRQVLHAGLPEQGSSAAGWAELSTAEDRSRQPRLEGWGDDLQEEGQLLERAIREGAVVGDADGAQGRVLDGTPAGDGGVVRPLADKDGSGTPHRPRPDQQRKGKPGTVAGQPQPQARGAWPVCGGCGKPILPKGLGTALKPALEPITMARKPLHGAVAANVAAHGTGGLNIDGCRVLVGADEPNRRNTPSKADAARSMFGVTGHGGTLQQGRWPANLIHDGSDEVLAAFPDAPGQMRAVGPEHGTKPSVNVYGDMGARPDTQPRGDAGSAARFFYCAKADRSDRNEGLQDPGPQFKQGATLRDAENLPKAGNHHPTVKPTDLMRYLCRLVTPPGGLVLDPFMGSGSTLKAAELEGFSAIGIELDPAYVEIARRRIAADAPLFAEVTA